MSTPRWYVVKTRPRHEKVVAEQIHFKAIEAFLPIRTTPSRWKDRSVFIDRPIFPGYVFIHIDLNDRRHVFSIPGVVRMLSFNGAAAAVDDAEIDAIRLCLKAGTEPEQHPFLQAGELVRVTGGPLMGLEGLVTRHKNRCRIVISIALIHQSIAVEVDAGLLEPVGRPSQVGIHSSPANQANFVSRRHRFASRETPRVHLPNIQCDRPRIPHGYV